MNKIIKGLKNPWKAIAVLFRDLAPKNMDDELYVKLDYFFGMKKIPNLKAPKTYNEKICWLKLHCKNPEYTKYVDKYEVKEYVAAKIGNEYIIPTIGIWDNFDDIDINQLPNQFVLKCTHDSGNVFICKDKKTFNFNKARKELNKSLKKNYFYRHREYPYKNVKARIIAEKFMADDSGKGLKDYKFFCFDGKVRMLYIATDRPFDTRFDFYDRDFNHLPFKQAHPIASREIEKPREFEGMVKIAEILSKEMPHVRIDLYDINGNIYFGEMTFFHMSGNSRFNPNEWDYKIGEWLTLPKERL